MALKMVHLAVYPMAPFSALAIAAACAWLARPAVCWLVVVLLSAAAIGAIVEYLVPQELTAYWLHHAALGNPSYPPPGTPPPVLVYRDACDAQATGASTMRPSKR